MSPIESQFTYSQPPPGYFSDSSAAVVPNMAEQDFMDLQHLAHLSRTKLDNLFRSRKDSGLLKHVLIHNLSRSYEELVPENEIVTEEREDGYDEIMIQHDHQRRSAEEMWLDACLQDLEDDDDEEGDYEDQDLMYTSYPQQYYYTTGDSMEDVSSDGSTPSLSPDMPSLDESELDEDEDSLSTLPFMDAVAPQNNNQDYIDRRKQEEFAKLHYLKAQKELERWRDIRDVGEWVYY